MYQPPPGRPVSTPPDETSNYQSTATPMKPQRLPGEASNVYATRVQQWLRENDQEWVRKFSASVSATRKLKRSKHRAALRALNKTETRGIWVVGEQLADVGVFKSVTSIYYRARVENLETQELRGVRVFLIPHDSHLMQRYLDALAKCGQPAPKPVKPSKPSTPPVAVDAPIVPKTLWQRVVGWFR